MWVFSCSAFTFFPRPIITSTGRRVRIDGSGPPVVFSGGLHGMLGRDVYKSFLSGISTEFTIVTNVGSRAIRKSDVEDIADRLNVSRVGFVAHSSFDTDILGSDRVFRSALVGPNAVPELCGVPIRPRRRRVKCRHPVLVASNRVPDGALAESVFNMFMIDFTDGNTTRRQYTCADHWDLMDDPWASFAGRVTGSRGGGDRGLGSGETVPIREWKRPGSKAPAARAQRHGYRATLAADIKHFFISDEALSRTPELPSSRLGDA